MITDQFDFSGKAAVVTGGGTGIGYETALQFAQLGASVVIASRGQEELERSAAQIRALTGSACLAVPTDVKDEAACMALIARAVDAFGRIDVLVNNAGGTRMGPLEGIPTRGWDSVFDLNARSAYICTREAGPHMMAKRDGVIINVSSNAGTTGAKGGAHYSSAKAALQMFTMVTAAEWGRYGIRANCVAAGMIASARAAAAWAAAGIEDTDLSATIPLGRTGTPREVANAIVFLASDAASYISGQVIAVNGGPSMGGMTFS